MWDKCVGGRGGGRNACRAVYWVDTSADLSQQVLLREGREAAHQLLVVGKGSMSVREHFSDRRVLRVVPAYGERVVQQGAHGLERAAQPHADATEQCLCAGETDEKVRVRVEGRDDHMAWPVRHGLHSMARAPRLLGHTRGDGGTGHRVLSAQAAPLRLGSGVGQFDLKKKKRSVSRREGGTTADNGPCSRQWQDHPADESSPASCLPLRLHPARRRWPKMRARLMSRRRQSCSCPPVS